MAIVTRPIAQINGGEVLLSYQFDDTTGNLLAVLVENNGERGTVSVIVRDPTTRAELFTGSRNAKEGLRTYAIPSGAPFDLVQIDDPKNPGTLIWVLPYIVETAWG